MRTRSVLLVLSLVPLATASATDFAPTVLASIHDQPVDGAGDSFAVVGFEGLMSKIGSTQEDRAIQEFDIAPFAGATLASATIRGTVFSNNSFDVGARWFDFLVYGGNGVGELSDYQIAATLVFSTFYHPPVTTSFTYSFDATSAVQALISGGATWIGLRVQCNSDPNFPNILDDTTSRLSLVAAQTTGIPFCTNNGLGAACPCAPGFAGNGCANSAFVGGGHLAASGNAGASAGTDTLVLTATNIPGPGLFFQASGISNAVPFGDGRLCAVSGITRLGVVFPTGSTASYPGGLTPNPIHIAGAPIANGDVRHYQVWYRDSASFCTGDTYNLTQGVSMTWGP